MLTSFRVCYGATSWVCCLRGGIKTYTYTHTQIHYVYVHYAYGATFISGSSSATSASPATSATVSAAALAASSSSPRQQLHLIVSKICKNFFQAYRKLFKRLKWVYTNPLSTPPFLPIPLISLNMLATCCFHVILHCQAQLCAPSVAVCVCADSTSLHLRVGVCMCVCACMYVCACVGMPVFICRSAKCMMIFQLVIFIFAFRQRLWQYIIATTEAQTTRRQVQQQQQQGTATSHFAIIGYMRKVFASLGCSCGSRNCVCHRSFWGSLAASLLLLLVVVVSLFFYKNRKKRQ